MTQDVAILANDVSEQVENGRINLVIFNKTLQKQLFLSVLSKKASYSL